jgi:exosome complex component RRP42
MFIQKIKCKKVNKMFNPKNHIIKGLNKGIRLDGRKTEDYREVELEYGVSKTAEGSAKVKIGDTEVIAGAKLLVGTPYPDAPDSGTLMVNAELLPLSSPRFESGPPSIEAIELARVVDRGIRESKEVDIKQLCITKGEKVWIISIDICTINDAGNLLDASALAAIAAIKDARFPEFDGEKVDYKKLTDKTLPIKRFPIAVTVLKIGDYYIVDPLREEEECADARLTVTNKGEDIICALQKGGDLPLTSEDVDKMVRLATEKSKYLKKFL